MVDGLKRTECADCVMFAQSFHPLHRVHGGGRRRFARTEHPRHTGSGGEPRLGVEATAPAACSLVACKGDDPDPSLALRRGNRWKGLGKCNSTFAGA